MEALLCEYGEGTKKASSDMDVEELTLEKDADKSNSKNNIDSVSTEEVKNARSETLEALHTEDDTKNARSENMVQDDVEDASSVFDIYNTKFSREDGFWP